MGVLQRFEQRLDRLVNGAFARAFRAEVQPVEIAAALQRELDDKSAVLDRARTVAPNRLVVELSQSDFDRLAPYAGPLGTEFAAMVTEHATAQNYHLLGPAEVALETADDLPTGVFRVASEGRAGITATPRAHADQRGESVAQRSEPADQTGRLVVNDTAYPLSARTTTIGRGTEVDIRIDDPGVSRRHAEFRLSAAGGFSVIDLASTNGTFIGDERVAERVLADGDQIRVGGTVLTYRAG